MKTNHTKKEAYKDIYGDVWVRISRDALMRLRDNNIGGWFNGNGLTRTNI